MIYPPEIQHRLARFGELSPCAQDAVDSDIVTFVKQEIRVHKGLRPDAYPRLYPRELSLFKRKSLGCRLFEAFRPAATYPQGVASRGAPAPSTSDHS